MNRSLRLTAAAGIAAAMLLPASAALAEDQAALAGTDAAITDTVQTDTVQTDTVQLEDAPASPEADVDAEAEGGGVNVVDATTTEPAIDAVANDGAADADATPVSEDVAPLQPTQPSAPVAPAPPAPAGSPAASAEMAPPAELLPSATLSGVVRSTSGAPLANVALTLAGSSSSTYESFVTGADGAFTFPNLQIGNYSIYGFLAGYSQPMDSRTVTVTAGGVTHEIVLSPHSPVSGSVVDGNGAPVSGVTVMMYSETFQPTTSVPTDAAGTFELNMEPGRYYLRVWGKDGTRQTSQWYTAGGGEPAAIDIPVEGTSVSGIDVMLTFSGFVDGLLLLPDGTPTEGNLSVFDADGRLVGHASADAAGAFRTAGLEPGTYRLEGVAYAMVGGEYVSYVGSRTITADGNDLVEVYVHLEVEGDEHIPAPVAVDDAYSVAADGLLQVDAPGVLANDHNFDDEAPYVAGVVSGPAHGELAVGFDGSFVYQPLAGFVGLDSFVYRIEDEAGGPGNTAVVMLRVGLPDPETPTTDPGSDPAHDPDTEPTDPASTPTADSPAAAPDGALPGGKGAVIPSVTSTSLANTGVELELQLVAGLGLVIVGGAFAAFARSSRPTR